MGYTHPKIPAEDLGRFYPDGYHDFGDAHEANLPLRGKLFHAIGRRINPGYLERFSPGRILDVGCGNGLPSKHLVNEGHTVVGVEINPSAAQAALSIGLKVLNEDFLDTDLEPESFQTVIMRHSLEHMSDFRAALEKAHLSLKPSGTLYVCVPNMGSLPSRMFGRYWFPLEVPRHFYHFSVRTLRTALSASGFEISKVMFDYSTEPLIIAWSLNYFADRKLDFLLGRMARILHVTLYPIGLLLAATSLSSDINVRAHKVEA